MFGSIFIAAVMLFEIPTYFNLFSDGSMPKYTIIFLIIPILIAIYMFVIGAQVINISDRGVTLEVFRVPLKDIEWDKINEAGTGTVKIGRDKYMRQLYVSNKKLTQEQVNNLDKMKFDSLVIWFDFSQKAQDSLASHLGI